MLQSVRRTVAALVLAAAAPAVVEAQVAYNNFASFLSAVGPNGIDSFDDLQAPTPGPLSRSAGSFGYSVAMAASPLDQFFPIENAASAGDWWLSEETAGSNITFSGFGPTVRAIGGSFFATDFSGSASGTAVRIRAVDVNGLFFDQTFASTSSSDFFGVVFDNALATLQISAINTAGSEFYFATANDLVLATVPEPSTMWLLAIGGSMLVVVGRRRRQR
jgi:hypothetical protein